jgi:cytochrome c oxidase subunit II
LRLWHDYGSKGHENAQIGGSQAAHQRVRNEGEGEMTATGLRISSLVAALGGLAPGLAFAAAGQPETWQIVLQDPATPVAEYIHWFNTYLLVIIVAIATFVLALLVYVMWRFNAKANPVPSKTTHHVGLEIAWTLIPVLILVAIVAPSMNLLYMQRNIPPADLTVKVMGNPGWNWTYFYPDLGVDDSGEAKVQFTATLLSEEDAKKENRPYLLASDTPMIVPVNKTVKMIVTSDPIGIIHAWTIPSFGMKIDAIPGRLNEDWFKATKEGVYYGQCSELCGKEHAYMPIEVHVVSEADYNAWVGKVKTAGIEAATKFIMAQQASKPQPSLAQQ